MLRPRLPAGHRALTLCPPELDPKWRFFWRIGERPDESETEFADLNAPPVVPSGFAGEWEETMNGWGSLLFNACTTVAEMLAIGNLPIPRCPSRAAPRATV